MRLAPFLAAIALIATPALAAASNPLPPGAQRVHRPVEDVTEFDIALTPLQVAAYYRKTLLAAGWKGGDTMSYGTTLVLDVSKAPKSRGRVTIAPLGPGKTHVTVSFTD
ncbi:MAG TPA: hypothetical protein VHL34_15595 [Rhizomicrobium sp.]|jgi:hypothetical protein|nr:hypothetical protein [Rhizomicrobium sp.]